jgi:hypothetical protein
LLFVALAAGFVALVDYSSEFYFYFPLARTRRQGLDGLSLVGGFLVFSSFFFLFGFFSGLSFARERQSKAGPAGEQRAPRETKPRGKEGLVFAR